MECVYAIALYASQASQFMNRLAIVSTGLSYPYSKYSLYQAPKLQHVPNLASESNSLFPHFPAVNGVSPILMAHDSHDSPNTYVAVYCSLELSRQEMETKIVHGLQPITRTNPHLSRDNRESEKRCLAYITKLSQQKRATLISNSEIIAWHDCSEEIIASLAYQNKISVVGDHNKFAPQNFCESCIRVNADSAFQMRNLISDDQFFLPEKTSPQPSALAWYQGHLHVFVQSLSGNLWRPITKLGREERNAHEIIKWLEDSGTLKPYLKFKEKYKDMVHCLDRNDPNFFQNYELHNDIRVSLAKRFDLIKIRQLVPSRVTGEIGQHFDIPSMLGS
ncbi:unnamed protein product [Blumeria hordei]|uniref:Uncharacterized protein n=1 Tax=Blumeria hordei TaxID=2867405 RepID=A0A383V2L2_BLUHO|nr:unnamed protein product [Blumeria hordei]